MSKISIEGNASGTGTFTIAAPNTNSNYTLTLPEATGTIITTAGGEPISGTTGSFSGNLSFNSGYGSAAVAYGCRAWVNFDGTSNSANLTGTYSQTGTTVTVTITAHGYITGNSAYLDFTTGTAVDGTYTVTVVDANTFTVTQASRTTSGNVTDRRNAIRASGNVSSITDNGTGDYTVNFTTAMPDANYSPSFMCQFATSGGAQSVAAIAPLANAQTTTSMRIYSFRTDTAASTDFTVIGVSVFR